MRRLLPVLLAATMTIAASADASARHPVMRERGLTFTGWWHDAYASTDAETSFSQLAATGANAVALIATQYQRSPDATEVVAHPERTPSDTSLATAVGRAKAAGLLVRLRLLVDVESGEPRVQIAPRDPHAWFAAYRKRLLHYAAAAQRWGVDALEIGAELPHLSGRDHTGDWRSLARATRTLFRGRLSYGANWNEYRHIRWWDAIDEIGVDAYFPLALAAAPTEDELVAAWSRFVDANGREHRYRHELAAVARRFRRPVVFSELGYPSAEGAHMHPWRPGGIYSAAEQQVGLAAAIRALAGQPWFRGAYVWHWNADPTAGGPGDPDHTIQGKPALATVAEQFARAARAQTRTSMRVLRAGRRGRRLVLSGRVHGIRTGAVRVRAMQFAGRRWRPLTTRRAVVRQGRFALRVAVPRGRRLRLRAVFNGSTTAAPSLSRVVLLDSRP